MSVEHSVDNLLYRPLWDDPIRETEYRKCSRELRHQPATRQDVLSHIVKGGTKGADMFEHLEADNQVERASSRGWKLVMSAVTLSS